MKKIRHFIVLAALALSSYATQAQTVPAIKWQKSLGGSIDETATSTQQTSDGGYVVAGYTYSNDGDVTGNHGNYDYWVVKVNSTGVLQWQKTLGGSGDDFANSIQQTSDGGFIVAGYSNSHDGDVTDSYGAYDFWIVKLNSTGVLQWQKSLGGSGFDLATNVKQTNDGGYIVAGSTASTNGDITFNHGSYDFWVVKLDNTGVLQWQTTLGGTGNDNASSIQQTSDGGYIVGGSTNSTDGDVTGNQGNVDFWVVKLDNTGVLQWQKTLGGSGDDNANSIQQTSDGGYIVAGLTNSNDGDVTGNHGGYDSWVVKLTSTGAMQWQRAFGGSASDNAISIQQTSDGGYVVGGSTNSTDGDVTGNKGSNDSWIFKVSSIGMLQWQKTLGGSAYDEATSIQQTWDGGYIVGGSAESNDGDVTGNHGSSDYWLVKLCNVTTSTSNATACDSLVWNGKTYKTTGSYNDTLTNAAGCDSIATLNLIVNHSTTSDTTATVCNSFTWHGATYYNSGDKTFKTTTTAGCDSVITLHLTIKIISNTVSHIDAVCYGSATGSITITPTDGMSPFSYRIGTTGSYTPGSSSYTFSNLKAGTYRAYVQDATGCIGVAGGIVVSQNAKVTATGTSTPLTCNGSANGTITIDNPVGIAPFKYKIGSGGVLYPFTAPYTITGLAAGNYRIFVVDANGCSSASIVVPVTQPAPPAVNYSVIQPTCSTPTGTISLSTTDTAGATYKINPGSSIYKVQSTYANLAAGTYYGYAKDAAGCVGRSVAIVLSPATGCRSLFAKGTKAIIEAGSNALSVSISPNPSSNVFKLTPHTVKAETIQLRVIDVNGKVVYTAKGSPTQALTFGEALTVGIYLIELRQGSEMKTYKVVKTL